MPIFNQIKARRPGEPWRATDTALTLSFATWAGTAALITWPLSKWKPFDLPIWQHFTAPVFQTQAWINSLDFPALAWYSSILIPSAVLAGFVFVHQNRERISVKHIRGRRFFDGNEAIKIAKKAVKKMIEDDNGEKGLEIAPGIFISRAKEVQSVMVVGAQGGGKTVFISWLLLKILARGDRCLIFDPVKGDYSRWVPGALIVSNTDSRSIHWWLGFDLRNISDAQAFSAGVIPESDDPLWSNAARGVLVAVIIKLIHEKGQNWSWPELNELAFLPIDELSEIAETYYPPASASVADAKSKTSQSIQINLHVWLAPIFNLALAFGKIDKKRFSFKKWMDGGYPNRQRLIVQMNQSDSETGGAMARAIVSLLTTYIASLEFEEDLTKKRRIWWFLDEIPQFGRLECISKINAVGRSKGVASVFGFQDISQIRQIYPQHEDMKWMALFGTRVFPQVVGADSQEWVCRQIGDREVSYLDRSVSGAVNSRVSISDRWSSPTREPVLLPSDLESFGKQKNGIKAVFLGLGKDVLALNIPFSHTPQIRKPHVPWADGVGVPPGKANETSNDSAEQAYMNSNKIHHDELAQPRESHEPQEVEVMGEPNSSDWKFSVAEEALEGSIAEEETKAVVDQELQLLEAATGLHEMGEVFELVDSLPTTPNETHHAQPSQPKKRLRRSRYQVAEAEHE